MRLGLFRLTLAVVSMTFAVAMGELFVRIAAPQPVSWLAIYRSHPDLPFFSMLPDTRLFLNTGETEWTVTTDERGFRVPEQESTAADCSALWLGDSFAFGHGVDYAESFVGRIEQQTDRMRHVNASVSGYGPVQYRQTLEYLGDHELDFDWIFVASYVGNDFHDTQWEKNDAVVDGILGNQGDLKSFLKRSSHAYRLVSSAYHAITKGADSAADDLSKDLSSPAAWERDFLVSASRAYESEMRRIHEYATSHGKDVFFLIIPTREAVGERHSGRSAGTTTVEAADGAQPALPVMRARAILDGIGAPYLDLTDVLSELPTKEMFFRFDGHFTPPANQLVADAFMRQVRPRCQ